MNESEDIKKQKKALRRMYLDRRAAMGMQARTAASAAICGELCRLARENGVKTVFSYMPMREETDVSAFHTWAAQNGVRVAFPVTGKGGQMEAWIPNDPAAMRPDRYGIPAPDPADSVYAVPDMLDMILVPCVAFTAAGARLGHGGGYYDRYMARCPRALRVLPAFEAQCAEELPRDEYDLPVNVIVTEKHTVKGE